MGYQGIMGYGVDFPLSRLGKGPKAWVFTVYGLPEVWLKRESTVYANLNNHRQETDNTTSIYPQNVILVGL